MAGAGLAVAAVLVVVGHVDPANLDPSLQPLRWPDLPIAPVLGIALGLLPAWLAPPVRQPVPRRRPEAVAVR